MMSMIFLIAPGQILAQSDLLASGPMVGYSTMKEVALWVQTTESAQVKIQYWAIDSPEETHWTEEVTTQSDAAYSTHLIALTEPDLKYQYCLYINAQKVERPYPLKFQSQELWHWRRDPPEIDFLLGSCAYVNEPRYDRPGRPYGQKQSIFKTMAAEEADFMMWLGDNIYLREADWNSRTGILHRYSHVRAVPEMQAFLGSTHHYAIWDDHDYGPNDSDRSYWGKNMTEEAFKLFWANPNYDLAGEGGITGTFIWGDCQFFLLDNRYHRTHQNADHKEILGEAQRQWLYDALLYSKASFKFICVGGQFLSDAALFENHAVFPEERQEIIDWLDEHNMHGVVFLGGDRHSSEITKYVTGDDDVFYDVTCSALSSKTYDHKDEPNTLRIPGTSIGINNYGKISVTGALNERKLVVHFRDIEGKDIIKSTELKFPERKRN